LNGGDGITTTIRLSAIRVVSATAALLGAVVGCGGSNPVGAPETLVTSPTTDSTTTSSSIVQPTVDTTPKPKIAGEMTDVRSPGGLIDGQEADPGDKFAERASLVVNPEGLLEFELSQGPHRCTATSRATLVVRPDSDTLALFTGGSVVCRTSTNKVRKSFQVEGGYRIEASDPVFRVEVDGDDASVQVLQGFVAIVKDDQRTVVGPAQQVTLAGGQASGLGPFDAVSLPKDDATAMGRYLDVVTSGSTVGLTYPAAPDKKESSTVRTYTPLDDASPTVIPVLVNETSGAGDVQSFASQLLGRLSVPWNLSFDVAVRSATAKDVPKPAGIVVTTSKPPDAQAIPFIDDGTSTWWLAVDAKDVAFKNALQGFLVTSLQARCPAKNLSAIVAAPRPSCYASTYVDVFGGGTPSLDPFADLLALG
jgi:hypothetical protein